jgi:hypothetical protein
VLPGWRWARIRPGTGGPPRESRLEPHVGLAPSRIIVPPHDDNPSARWFLAETQPPESALSGRLRPEFPTVRDVGDVRQESFRRIWRARAAAPFAPARAGLSEVARRIALDAIGRGRHDLVADAGKIGASSVCLVSAEKGSF